MSLLIEALKRAEHAKNQQDSFHENVEETLSFEIPDEPLSFELSDDVLLLDDEPVLPQVSSPSIIDSEVNNVEWTNLETKTEDAPQKIIEKEEVIKEPLPFSSEQTPKQKTNLPPSDEPLSKPWTTEEQADAAARLQAASDSASLKPLLGYILLLVVMLGILGGGYFYVSEKVEEYTKSPYANNTQPLPAGGLAAKLAEIQKKTQPEQPINPIQPAQITQTPAETPPTASPKPVSVSPKKVEEKVTASQTKTSNKRLKIEHNSNKSPIDQRLQQAYQFYQQGHYKNAKKRYQLVLQEDEHNRDALLGLAAIAVQNQQVEQARHYYQQVLHFYPQDNIAAAGLIDLQDDTTNGENTLKNQINDQPESAYLQFVLGNFYSRQSRWNEAQQAYFEAYRRNNQHPDYAYNLAVSLDQLGKNQAALPYYQRALSLRDNHQATFNIQTVKQRISEIEK